MGGRRKDTVRYAGFIIHILKVGYFSFFFLFFLWENMNVHMNAGKQRDSEGHYEDTMYGQQTTDKAIRQLEEEKKSKECGECSGRLRDADFVLCRGSFEAVHGSRDKSSFLAKQNFNG